MLLFNLLLSASATEYIAVLDSSEEFSLQSQILRTFVFQEIEAYPNVQMIDKENMLVIMEDMGSDLSCLSDATCTVDTGRVIGADYIVRNDISLLEDKFWFNISMYSTATGGLLYSDIKDYDSLELLNFHLQVIYALEIVSHMDLGEKKQVSTPTIINQTVIDPYAQFRYERAIKRRNSLKIAGISLASSAGIFGLGWGVKALGEAANVTFFSLRPKPTAYTMDDFVEDLNNSHTE